MPKPRDSAEFLSSSPAPSDPILDAWARVLAEHADEVAVLGGNGETLRTFSQIEEESRTCGERFKGLPGHAVVAVKIGNSPSWPAVFLALLRAGHVTLPLGSDAVPPEPLVVATVDESLRLQGCSEADLHRWRPPLPPEITLLKLTSGTTGAPRAIRFTSAQLLADCDQICETMGITAGDVNFGAIPIAHSYGFSNLLTPLLLRGVRLALTEDRLPRALLTGFGKTGATVFPGTPVLFQHLAEVDAARPVQLRLCISAGAPLNPAVWESFRTRYGLCIHVFYGSSECGGIAYSRGGNLPEEGFVGQAMQGVTVTPLGDGRIEVRSPAVSVGYFPADDPAILGHGRFIPGDLVQQSATGLVLVGRASEFINVAGRKLNPSEVERHLAEFPGVETAVVFGVPSKVRGEVPVACVAGDKVDTAALLRHCTDTLPAWQVPRDLWVVPSIPVNDRGKISRRGLAEMYLARVRSIPGIEPEQA
jgi:acyl-CoA synthetase (AMP-forming)/AMP-acid ligase II